MEFKQEQQFQPAENNQEQQEPVNVEQGLDLLERADRAQENGKSFSGKLKMGIAAVAFTLASLTAEAQTTNKTTTPDTPKPKTEQMTPAQKQQLEQKVLRLGEVIADRSGYGQQYDQAAPIIKGSLDVLRALKKNKKAPRNTALNQ